MSLKKTAAELREYVKVAQAAYPYQMPAWENPAVESGTADIATVTPQMQRGYAAYNTGAAKVREFMQKWPKMLMHSGIRPEDVNLGTSFTATNSYANPDSQPILAQYFDVLKQHPGQTLRQAPHVLETVWRLHNILKGMHGFNPTNFQSWSSMKTPVGISFSDELERRVGPQEQVAFHELAHVSPQGRTARERWFGPTNSQLGRIMEEARANVLGAWNYTKANPMAIFKPDNYATFWNSMKSYIPMDLINEVQLSASRQMKLKDIATNELTKALSGFLNAPVGGRHWGESFTVDKITNRLSTLNPFSATSVWKSYEHPQPHEVGMVRRDWDNSKLTLPTALSMLGNPIKYLSHVADPGVLVREATHIGEQLKTLGLSFKDINPANYLSKNPS